MNLFNGRNLDGWVIKIAGHELGDNYGDTFRVAPGGVIQVSYDKYDKFAARFSHLFYKQKLSHYRLALEYRFTGEQMKDCLLYTSPSPRDRQKSRMPSSA